MSIALLVAIVGALLAAVSIAAYLVGFARGRARGERSWRDGWNAGYDEAVSYWGTRLAIEKQQAAASKTPATSEAPQGAAKEIDAALISEKPSQTKKPN